MLERYLLVWLVLSSLVAYAWEPILGSAAVNPFAASAPYLSYLFALTMFAVGWLLPRDEIRQLARRWPAVVAGTVIQYTTMPLLAFAAAGAFGLQGPARIGIILAGCVPGAMASNVLSLIARANVSYSVSLTTLATIVSPLTVPLGLKLLLGAEVPVKVAATALNLLLVVVLPVIAGHLASRRLRRGQHLVRRLGAVLANLTILWIIAVVVAKNRQQLEAFDLTLAAALLCLNLLGYAAGWLGGWCLGLESPMRRALTLEVGMQNAGLGTILAMTFFGSAAAVAPAMYTFGCMLTGSVLAQLWARRDEKSSEAPRPTSGPDSAPA